MSETLQENKLAFDIGCNIGKYTLALLDAGWEKVIAVDPVADTYMINQDPRVIRIVGACSDKIKEIPFYDCYTNTISTAEKQWTESSRFAQDYRWREIKVPALPIDILVATYGIPQHIKIDVEGYELTVLKGMSQKYADKLCFEWAEEMGDMAVECVEYLYRLGYTEFGYIITDTYLKEPDNYYSKEKFLKEFKYNKDRKTEWGMIWAK